MAPNESIRDRGTILVLLSSYNGEQYLKEQLDSILGQDCGELEVLIRDDGSKDGTVGILQEYEKNYKNLHVIYGKNLGAAASFFELIRTADRKGSYYAFADQDDVWMADKLSRAVGQMEEWYQTHKKPDRPGAGPLTAAQDGHLLRETEALLYCSAVQPVDSGLNPLPSGVRYSSVRPSFGNALVENMCTGCTCVMNGELFAIIRDGIPDAGTIIMHDFWFYLTAGCFGTVLYDREAHILYRQHSGSQLGTATSFLSNYRRRFRNFKRHRYQLTRQAEEFLKVYEGKMPENCRRLAAEFAACRYHIRSRVQVAFGSQVYRQRKSDNIILKLLILAGIT